jgi:hypothetical protein
MSKTIVFNNNKIEIFSKPIIGKETIFYNNTLVPSISSFGNVTNVFLTVEELKRVQYDVELCLRWHCLSFYTIIKREGKIIYSDK